MKKELVNLEDIKLLVDSFYGKVRQDELLSDIFNDVIQDRWPVHLQKMYGFWETVLLDGKNYNGRPFPPHAELPVDREHFERWIALFHGTLDELFTGEKAEEAKWRSTNMAAMFLHKINSYKTGNARPI